MRLLQPSQLPPPAPAPAALRLVRGEPLREALLAVLPSVRVASVVRVAVTRAGEGGPVVLFLRAVKRSAASAHRPLICASNYCHGVVRCVR